MNTSLRFRLVPRAIATAVALALATPVLANPTGAQVVNGSVSMSQPNASTLNITNSPGAIINWQGFSIGANEVTRFIQQSASSAVLNRVVGPDISAIQGQLLSNGRVFLINPAGIVVGPNAMIDTAGFVGSALNLSNADFLAGKLRFSGDATSGSVINQGWIRTSFGGNVLLVAPNIQNSGLIQTPGGELILAAGQKLTVSSMEQGGVQFEVQAPADSVLNVGKLLADGGAVGVFAGTLKHSGEIRANALVKDAAGNVVLQAAKDVAISGSVTATSSTGKGGGITVTGERVSAADGAVFDVSGGAGGGQILLGGDYQGANAAVRNATTTVVGNATLRADATNQGDGGRIIVWADENTRFTGAISAQGGPLGGNGGFAEVSGRNNLYFGGTANLSAPKGLLGTLLLDPLDLYVATGGGVDGGAGKANTSTIIDEATDFPSSAVTVSPDTFKGIAGNVNLYASRYMRISNDVTLTTAGQSLTATVGKYTAPALPDPNALDVGNTPNRLDIAANITTNNGAITMNAPLIQTAATAKLATVGGAIALTSGTNLSTGSLSLDAGAGAVTLAVGADSANFMQLSAITGGTVTANAPSSISMGNVTTGAGALTLTSTGGSVNTSNVTSTGGAVNLSAAASSINTGSITGGGAAVTLAAKNGISTGIIDTTGAVGFTTTAGSINTTVNNASKVTASATNSFSSASVNINSTTALNADSVTVNVTDCSFSTSCPGASISLNATGNITFGTLTANAPATTNNASVFNNSISRSVTLTSNGGSILASGPSSLITGTDVTLRTQQGSGGGIGTAATPVTVNLERQLDLRPNGDFNVAVTGAGPTRLTTQLGVAATGKTYTGNLTSGSLNFNASATDTTVTVGKFTATGLTQRLYGQDPSINLSTPNGALTVTTMSVPEGDTRPNDPPFTFPAYSTAGLPVNVSATGALTVNNYTRNITGASLPKATSFSSSGGSVTLGTINAGKDTVSVSASGTGSNIAITDLSTAGGVTVSASSGDVTLGRIDTSSGTGGVSVNASTTAGSIKAASDSAALEITSGGAVTLTGKTIGAGGFTNPFDVAGTSVSLTSTGATGGAIGFAGAPLVANTQSLTVNASPLTASPTANGAAFNISTGALALTTLNVTANPQAVGVAGPATVTTDGGKGVYTLVSDGTNFTFNPGTVPAAQFVKGALSVTANSGDFTLGAVDMGAQGGSLSITARNGSINAATLDGLGSINLSAGQSTGGANVAVKAGNIGAINRPSNVSIAAGNNSFSTSRGGTVSIGNVEAGGLSISTFTGDISVGNVGASARAGSVSLTANERSGTGKISAGTITASGLTTSSRLNSTTAGDIDVSGSVSMTSENTVTLGNVTASSLTIGPSFTSARPAITTNNIKGVQTTNLFGSTTTINGTVTGDPAGTGQLFIGGSSGMVTITGGSVTAGDGSTIAIDSQGATPFVFQTLNAGAKGIVSVASPAGIQQNTGGTGITGAEVALSAITAGKSILQAGGDGKLDITGTQRLTINAGGPVAIDGNGSTLTDLTISKTQSPGAAAFDLSALGGGQVVTLGGAANLALTVQSATNPLNFSLDYNVATSNVALAGAGINSGGGNVAITVRNGGAFDGTAGGIVTGGAAGGGAVSLSSTGLLSTGSINTTPTGTGTGGAINAAANGAGMTISGDLRTGTGGGAIGLSATTGGITRSGGAQIVSDTSVSVSATINTGAVDVGSVATPLLITSPSVSLTAGGFPVGGSVFATLTNTKALTLSADNGFAVTSNTAFDTLSVATRGAGTGVMTLTAPGQLYTFARPTVDLFGTALTNTFQVVAAAGTAPAANATFISTSGDLFVGGPGANITTPVLTLHTNGSGGDVKLQGTAANPLALNNTTQNIGNGFSTRDLLVRGNVALTGATQNLSVARSVNVQAEQGSITISGVDQSITTGDTVTKGAILFKGGAGAGEAVTITGSKTQLIQSPSSGSGAGIRLEGGDGAGSTASIVYTGTDTQRVQGGGNVAIVGGKGNNAVAEIRTATGSQFVSSELNVDISGGAGTGSAARIINTGTGNQQVGESRRSGFFTFPYQTDNMTITAGSGNDAIAEINATGAQQVYVNSGKLTLQAGGGTNAFARIDNTAASEQLIGCATYFGGCSGGIGIINVLAGTGTGAYARITGTGAQRITSNSQINLTGAATDATATITGAGQDIRSGTTTLLGGAGNNANALIQATGDQNFQGGIALTGGGAAGATATAQVTATGNQTVSGSGTFTFTGGVSNNSFVRMSSGGNQSINFGSMTLNGGASAGASASLVAAGTQTLSGGNLTLKAGGAAATPAAGTHALIEGKSQQVSAGALTITGGTGDVEFGGASDALLRNLDGAQTLSTGAITITAGAATSTAAILNNGTGAQTITSSGAITLQSSLAGVTGSVLIRNTPATEQKLTANGGTFSLSNQGGGLISATSAGTQTVTARAIDVHTAPGSTGNSLLTATGNQWLRTTNGTSSGVGSMRVAALGTGLANIESGASQLIELDYPQMMQGLTLNGALTVGDAAAAGRSRIGAVDQVIFAKSALVQTGGPGAGTQSEIKSTGRQVISLLNGNLQVLGGSGANSLAQIDPVDQTILVNGGVDVIGGSGANSLAQILSQGTQTLWTTNGNILVQGGSGAGANASITATGVQSLSASGSVTALNGTGGTGTITGAAAPVSNNGAATLSGTPSGTVIALYDTQTGVVTEAEPEDNPNNNDPLRRAPVCF